MVNDVFCDGLGACIGDCPEGALRIIEREALEFDEEEVETYLESLKEVKEAMQVPSASHSHQCSCPSSKTILYDEAWEETGITDDLPSALRQWPPKLRLVSPIAPYFNTKELTIVSDCAPLAYGDFHRKILKGKPIVTICPMLNLGEPELEKLTQILKVNPIETINLILMEVPCCQKIRLFMDPIIHAVGRPIELRETIISRDGQILKSGKI